MAGLASGPGFRSQRAVSGGRRPRRRGSDVRPIYPPFLSAPGFAQRARGADGLARWRAWARRLRRWEMDLDLLEHALTPRTRLLLLCSPHNPMGRVWSRAELEALAEVACRYDLVIGSDEVHAGLVLDEDKRHIPIATLGARGGCPHHHAHGAQQDLQYSGSGLLIRGDLRPFAAAELLPGHGGYRPPREPVWVRSGSGRIRAAVDRGWKPCSPTCGATGILWRTRSAPCRASALTHIEATYLAWIDARDSGLPDPVGGLRKSGGGAIGRSGVRRSGLRPPQLRVPQIAPSRRSRSDEGSTA